MENNKMTEGELIMGTGAMILAFVFLFPIDRPYTTFLVLQPVVLWVFYEQYKMRRNQVKL